MKRPGTLLLLLHLIALILAAFSWSVSPASFRRNSALKAAEDGEDITNGYNVLGTELSCCCSNVGSSGIGTGFYRNGFCSTGDLDVGRHTVCCQVTSEFLEFSKSVGNDLSTPMPEYHFPGLNDGDFWCLCAQRWAQAYNAGKAPKLILQATHEKTLEYVPFDVLTAFAIDGKEVNDAIELNDQKSRLENIMETGESEESESFQ